MYDNTLRYERPYYSLGLLGAAVIGLGAGIVIGNTLEYSKSIDNIVNKN